MRDREEAHQGTLSAQGPGTAHVGAAIATRVHRHDTVPSRLTPVTAPFVLAMRQDVLATHRLRGTELTLCAMSARTRRAMRDGHYHAWGREK